MLKLRVFVSSVWIVVLVLWALPSLAQVDTAWVRRYNGPGNEGDWANAIAVDGHGNVCVTGQSGGSGTTYDYATIKYYPDGDTAWARRYNGPANDEDIASAIAVDDSGNVYVTGWSSGTSRSIDYATIKYYPNGDTAWVRRYNGPGDGAHYARAIAVDDSGNAHVTGGGWGSMTTIKYYPNGDSAWARRHSGDRYASAIAVDDSGNTYVTGVDRTLKYDSYGNLLWVSPWGGVDIAVDDSGNVYVTGWTYASGPEADYATIKCYPNGDTAWVRTYNGPGASDDLAYAITLDGYRNIYVTGRSTGLGTNQDYATIKYRPDGDTLWVRRYDGSLGSSDRAGAIAADEVGNVYVTGESFGLFSQLDYLTLKYYPNGDIAWIERYDGPISSWDAALAMAVDGAGNVYVTGYSAGSGTGSVDFATVKYHQYNDPPDAFSLLSPPNKALTPRVVRFDWEDAVDPNPFDQVRYDFCISTSYHSFMDYASVDSNLTLSEHTKVLDYGPYYWKVVAKDNFGLERESDQICYFMVTGIAPGDFSGDGAVDGGDVVLLINYLFVGDWVPQTMEAGDCNCDGAVDIADVMYLIDYLFLGGSPPGC